MDRDDEQMERIKHKARELIALVDELTVNALWRGDLSRRSTSYRWVRAMEGIQELVNESKN